MSNFFFSTDNNLKMSSNIYKPSIDMKKLDYVSLSSKPYMSSPTSRHYKNTSLALDFTISTIPTNRNSTDLQMKRLRGYSTADSQKNQID